MSSRRRTRRRRHGCRRADLVVNHTNLLSLATQLQLAHRKICPMRTFRVGTRAYPSLRPSKGRVKWLCQTGGVLSTGRPLPGWLHRKSISFDRPENRACKAQVCSSANGSDRSWWLCFWVPPRPRRRLRSNNFRKISFRTHRVTSFPATRLWKTPICLGLAPTLLSRAWRQRSKD